MVSPSLNWRMWSWQAVVPSLAPCGMPLMTIEQVPQMPSRQSESNAIGSSPRVDEALVHDVEHFEERRVREMSLAS